MPHPGRPQLRLLAAAVFTLGISAGAGAQNAAFQDFFFAACGSATGLLAQRCAQTDGGQGDLSGDSESSLNPSQALSGTDSAFLAAQQRVQELGETLGQKRDGDGAAPRLTLGPWNLLLNAHGTSVDADRDPNRERERAYELDEIGLDLGVDYRINDRLVVGALFHWADSELSFDREADGVNFSPAADAGSIDGDAYGVTAYFSSLVGDSAYIDGSVGQTRLQLDLARSAVFQESNRVVPQTAAVTSAETDSDQFVATLNAGYSINSGSWELAAFLGLSYIAIAVDDYAEADLSDSGLAMQFATGDRDSLFGHVGMTTSRPFSMDNWVLLPQLRLEYVEELSADTTQATARYLQDGAANLLALEGLGEDTSRFDLAVGVSAILPNGWIPFLEYQQSFGMGDLDRYSVVAGLRVAL